METKIQNDFLMLQLKKLEHFISTLEFDIVTIYHIQECKQWSGKLAINVYKSKF
jgi:hypothetical protein